MANRAGRVAGRKTCTQRTRPSTTRTATRVPAACPRATSSGAAAPAAHRRALVGSAVALTAGVTPPLCAVPLAAAPMAPRCGSRGRSAARSTAPGAEVAGGRAALAAACYGASRRRSFRLLAAPTAGSRLTLARPRTGPPSPPGSRNSARAIYRVANSSEQITGADWEAVASQSRTRSDRWSSAGAPVARQSRGSPSGPCPEPWFVTA